MFLVLFFYLVTPKSSYAYWLSSSISLNFWINKLRKRIHGNQFELVVSYILKNISTKKWVLSGLNSWISQRKMNNEVYLLLSQCPKPTPTATTKDLVDFDCWFCYFFFCLYLIYYPFKWKIDSFHINYHIS